MKIVGNCKLSLYDNECKLLLKVNFKLPNKFFSVTRKKILTSFFFDRYDNYEQFLNDCVKILSDRKRLKEEAINMILGYVNETDQDIRQDRVYNQVLQLVKNNKEFTIEVDIES